VVGEVVAVVDDDAGVVVPTLSLAAGVVGAGAKRESGLTTTIWKIAVPTAPAVSVAVKARVVVPRTVVFRDVVVSRVLMSDSVDGPRRRVASRGARQLPATG
jgi:hypothetical protein